MIREFTVKNYKSILHHTIELGRINVFIGENGCGKTNILEAMAMAGAALTNKLSVEELFARGIRVAKASIMRSSFKGAKGEEIVLNLACESADPSVSGKVFLELTPRGRADMGWYEEEGFSLDDALEGESKEYDVLVSRRVLRQRLGEFGIYNANILALRGLHTFSRRFPLGIYGENLDVAMAALPSDVWADVLERAKCVSWLEDVIIDPADERRYQGHKLGQSKSNLYFHDRFMRRKNNVFSAENVNEGILHVLFYLTLFVSEGTPKVFGIDNIDSALNPQLCRDLVKQLAELAARYDRQALITTHNPAILDGLNLLDDEQRLFVVYRDDDGHTVTRRIKQKPDAKEGKYKLSELWMRGHLGGLPPERF